MSTEYIEIKKLVKSPLNVRKTASATADDELKASILAHGLMQNLVVTRGSRGKYQVIAGARRLEALKALQADGALPDDHLVPCQVVTEEHAAEMSLAENVVRLAMHPADQFEAFAALIDQGLTSGQVATRFGISEKLVEQRMRLARVAPELLAAYREEDLTLDALMAFTVTDDHEKQRTVYEGLNDWQKRRPGDIRELLTEQMLEASDKLVKFVGLETYIAAGGTTRTNLFGDEVYLENPEVLNALATEKLRLAEQELLAEGWGWVRVDPEYDWQATNGCSRIQPVATDAPRDLLDEKERIENEMKGIEEFLEKSDYNEDEGEIEVAEQRQSELQEKLNELEEQISAHSKFAPEQIPVAGCYAYVYHDGEFMVERGLVKRDDRKAADRASSVAMNGDSPAPEKPNGLSESLKRDLAAYRLGAAQSEIAKHPAIAFDLLVFKLALDEFEDYSGCEDGTRIASRNDYLGGVPGEDAQSFAHAQLEAVKETLPLDWLEPEAEAERFNRFCELPDSDKQRLLAYCVAASLKPKLGTDDPEQPTAYDIALSLTGGNVADYWRPTKDNYLGRVTKDQLLDIGKQLIGGDRGETWARTNASQKKGDIAAELNKTFSEPERPGMTPEQTERVRNWLPDGMAFMPKPELKPAKGKKARKAA